MKNMAKTAGEAILKVFETANLIWKRLLADAYLDQTAWMALPHSECRGRRKAGRSAIVTLSMLSAFDGNFGSRRILNSIGANDGIRFILEGDNDVKGFGNIEFFPVALKFHGDFNVRDGWASRAEGMRVIKGRQRDAFLTNIFLRL